MSVPPSTRHSHLIHQEGATLVLPTVFQIPSRSKQSLVCVLLWKVRVLSLSQHEQILLPDTVHVRFRPHWSFLRHLLSLHRFPCSLQPHRRLPFRIAEHNCALFPDNDCLIDDVRTQLANHHEFTNTDFVTAPRMSWVETTSETTTNPPVWASRPLL